MQPIDVIFAPDWREGVAYQTLLAKHLKDYGVNVHFLQGYKHILPLKRLLADVGPALFHLHWPEAYFPKKGDGSDWLRDLRFPLDLGLAIRRHPLISTAHNLHPHNRGGSVLAVRNYKYAFRQSKLVFAHSAAAKVRLWQLYRVPQERIAVIPHGDMSVDMPPLLTRAEAIEMLGLRNLPVCLIFGTIEPYKGIEEVIAFWKKNQPHAQLVIAGRPLDKAYEAHVGRHAEGVANVVYRPGWLSDDDLSLWLSATDVVIFNYRAIFTSGAAPTARSLGIPILIPTRLDTVDLAEPDPRVLRFHSFEIDFDAQLRRAIAVRPDYESARGYRRSNAWSQVAKITAAGYRAVLSELE